MQPLTSHPLRGRAPPLPEGEGFDPAPPEHRINYARTTPLPLAGEEGPAPEGRGR